MRHTLLEADVFAVTLRDLIKEKGKFTGTTKDLLRALEVYVGEDQRKAKAWPKAPNQAAKRINLIAPALRKSGVSVEHTKNLGKKIWTLSSDNADVEYQKLPN